MARRLRWVSGALLFNLYKQMAVSWHVQRSFMCSPIELSMFCLGCSEYFSRVSGELRALSS